MMFQRGPSMVIEFQEFYLILVKYGFRIDQNAKFDAVPTENDLS